MTTEVQFILDNYTTMPIKRLAKKINRSSTFVYSRLKERGLKVPKYATDRFRKESQYKKGRTSHNKGKKQKDYMSKEGLERVKRTRFKKGSVPHNTLHDGAISIRKDKSGHYYRYIRISKGKWDLLQREVWRITHGPIPKGMIIVFKDGDSMNCNIENLEMISRSENMKRNTIMNYPEELRGLMILNSKLKNKIRNAEQ